MDTQSEIDSLRDLCHKLGEQNRELKQKIHRCLAYMKLVESNQSDFSTKERGFMQMVQDYLEATGTDDAN